MSLPLSPPDAGVTWSCSGIVFESLTLPAHYAHVLYRRLVNIRTLHSTPWLWARASTRITFRVSGTSPRQYNSPASRISNTLPISSTRCLGTHLPQQSCLSQHSEQAGGILSTPTPMTSEIHPGKRDVRHGEFIGSVDCGTT